jgi:ABC-type uncharacterized transport system auxiliary subunit
MPMKPVQISVAASALTLAFVLGGCARGKDDQAAFDVCMEPAKKDPKYAKATFATKEQSNIQASTGDADIRVNVPYELEGKKGLYQCIASKQTDGTYKVAF